MTLRQWLHWRRFWFRVQTDIGPFERLYQKVADAKPVDTVTKEDALRWFRARIAQDRLSTDQPLPLSDFMRGEIGDPCMMCNRPQSAHRGDERTRCIARLEALRR